MDVIENAQIDAAGMVGICLYGQQHTREGNASLCDIGIRIFVPPDPDEVFGA